MADEVQSTLPDQVREAVAASNFKVVGEAPAFYTQLAFSNAVANQQQLQQLGVSIVAKATDLVTEKQIEEGGALVAALQQMFKGAQTTPPVT